MTDDWRRFLAEDSEDEDSEEDFFEEDESAGKEDDESEAEPEQEADDQDDDEDRYRSEEEIEADEADARRLAVAQADAVIAEANDIVDEPRYPGEADKEGMRVWGEHLEGILTERAAEQAAIDAVFEAEAAAAATNAEEAEPIDFSQWDAQSFNDLVDRATGSVQKHAPRSSVADDQWGRALRLIEGD